MRSVKCGKPLRKEEARPLGQAGREDRVLWETRGCLQRVEDQLVTRLGLRLGEGAHRRGDRTFDAHFAHFEAAKDAGVAAHAEYRFRLHVFRHEDLDGGELSVGD